MTQPLVFTKSNKSVKDIIGNGLTYDVETTESGAQFYGVNETWVESTSVVTQHTATTCILGGDADVDNFLKATRSNLQDLMGEQIAAKVKAIKKQFMQSFYYGYRTGAGIDAKKFDGLHYLLRYGEATYPNYPNTIILGGASTPDVTFGVDEIEKAIDFIKNGKADLVMMTKNMRRLINVYLHAAGGITYQDQANGRVQGLFGVPVGVSDYISDAENCDLLYEGAVYGQNYAEGTGIGTSDESTSIFILQFAPQAVCGIQSLPITTVKLGDLETKDGTRVRIKWYPSLMLQSVISAAKITGIDSVTQAVAAT